MSFQLHFGIRHKYPSLATGITLDATLSRGPKRIECQAKVDTGAQCCLFEREIGEHLDLNIESGLRMEMGTLAGSLVAFGHEITLVTLGLTFETVGYFAESYDMQRNILGWQGWLQLVRLAIIDYDEELYLSPYSQA